MTKELRQKFETELGMGTGSTRYRHLRELARINNLPLREASSGRVSIIDETIQAFRELTPRGWDDAFEKYCIQTKGQTVRLSAYGLEDIKRLIS